MLICNLMCQLDAHLFAGHSQNRTRMARSQLSLEHKVLDLIRKVKKAQGIRDANARLGKTLCKIFLRHACLINDLTICARFFNSIEVASLNVLYEGKLKAFRIIDLFDDDGHLGKTRTSCSLESALARNDLKTLALYVRTNQKRLQNANLSYGVRKLLKLLLIEENSRLLLVTMQERQ